MKSIEQHQSEMALLNSEVHPVLTQQELLLIRQYRHKLLNKKDEEIEKLIFEWVKTNQITRRDFVLLCRWHFQHNWN